MRLRNVKGAKEKIEASSYIINNYLEYRGNFKAIFSNDNPIDIEIGMGKGNFIINMAKANPNVNYIGIEKFDSVMVRAIEKLELEDIPNLKLIKMDAENIDKVFSKEIRKIYLNFSDPWPKERHAHRRLPGRVFLDRYRRILKEGGTVEFKTDNQDLFSFALDEAAEKGWEIIACTRDLHNEPEMNEGNVMTEYEERFSSVGNPICKVILRPGQQPE